MEQNCEEFMPTLWVLDLDLEKQMKNQYYVADILSVVPFCSLDIVSNMGMKVWEMVNLCHRWSGTKCLVTVSSSVKKQQNACSVPSLVYQDLSMCQDWPFKKATVKFLTMLVFTVWIIIAHTWLERESDFRSPIINFALLRKCDKNSTCTCAKMRTVHHHLCASSFSF